MPDLATFGLQTQKQDFPEKTFRSTLRLYGMVTSCKKSQQCQALLYHKS